MAAPIVLGITIRADGSAQVRRDLGDLRDELGNAGNAANRANRQFADMARGLKGLFVGIGLGALANDVLKVNREMQSLRTSLETVTGSAAGARNAFREIQQFAANTPYGVQQVTEAFIKLSNYGLKAGEAQLTSYGNTASAMGKSLDQMIEAVADAATGEFERLKEFGIKSSQHGAAVTFTFRGVETTIKNTSENIQAYLQKIGDTDFAGSMERQSKTIDGAISNLGDSWDNLLDKLLTESGEQWLAGLISGIADGVNSVGNLGSAMLTLNGTMASVGDYAAATWNAISDTAIAAINSILKSFPWLPDAAASAGAFIVEVLGKSWDITRNLAALAINAVIANFSAMGSAIGIAAAGIVEVFSQSFEKIKAMASGLAWGIDAALKGDFSFSGLSAAYKKETLSFSQVAKDINASVESAFATDYVEAFGEKIAAGAGEMRKLREATEKSAEAGSALGAATRKTSEAAKESSSLAQKAATEERNRREGVLKTIDALQFELQVNRLGDQDKTLQTELRQNLANAVGAEREEIAALVTQIHAEADARERQKAMWGELVKDANALDELKDSAADAQQLASLAQELKLQGLTNDAIGQRIDLEKEKAAAIAANPDLDPAQVSAYVEARSAAEATLQKLTSDGANKSADQLDAAYKRALENIQDSFADMFESLLSGDALASFEDFFDSVGKSLRKAISQNLALGIQNALSGNGGGGAGLLQSGLVFGAGLIASLFTRKTPAARELSAAENYNGAVAGTGAMALADSFWRDRGFQFQSQTALQFNKSLQYLSDTIMNAGGSIVDWIGSLGTKLASTSVVQSVAAFFKPVTSMIGQATSFISNIYANLTNLVSKGVSAIGQAVGLTAVGTGTANAGSGAAANAGVSAMQNVAGALAVIKFGFDLFQTWGDDNLTTHKKITNSLYAASDALLAGAAIYANWMAAAAAAVLNIGGVISDVFENGFNSENLGRLLLGPLSGLFFKQRTPNAWMNTYSPGGGDYTFNPNAGTYTATGNKSAYVGEATPFGMTVISTHELNLTTEEMLAAFGALLKTVKTVDTNLYNTINRLDAKFGETGRTMDFYNRLLSDGNPGRTSVSTRQDTSELNTGGMLLERYSWIVNRLADSGSVVGQALNAWFDVITGKFISASQDNSIMVVGIIDSLAANLEDFVQFPLQLVDLIGRSVKSVSQGGTPESVMQEIMGVLNTFNLVKQGFAQMNLDVDSNRIAAFLANVNAIGYGVQEAGLNLLAYGIALKKINGTFAASGDALMDTVERKFNDLKRQGLDNTQMNAYFGSFGLFANLFAEARVAFNEGDLDNAAGQIHRLSSASVETAKNVIDHAIAAEKLTHISREAAIATLVKSGKIEEATVAEAEYGVSVQKATQDMLAAMGFIQQLGYVTGRSLGMMGVSASTWQAAARNVINVFGDLEKAMQAFDGIARTFLSSDEYANYNLATVNRGLSNLRASNPELAGITEAGVTEALKGGNAGIAGFIERMAQGNGELAKATLEYVQLLGQRLALEKEMKDQLGQTSRAFSDFVKNLHAVRSSIAANINSLGGTASIDQVAFQQGVIDRLYAQLANTTDRAEQVSIIGEINGAIMDRYNAELDMLGQVDDAVKQIRGYLDNLKLSDKSPLTNGQKLAEAQAQFMTQLAAANAGDKEARASITSYADAYLQQKRVYEASSQAYTDTFNFVTSALENLAIPSGMDEATYKAETLRLQDAAISELQSLDKTLLDIYAAEQTAQAVRHAELVTALASGNQALLIETAMNDATMALGRALTDFESQWIRDQFNSGRDKSDIYAEAGQYIQQEKLHGSHATGLDYVPFDGYRAELHKGERVLTAAQARRQDGESDQALIAELRALRAEVAQLRADQRAHTEAIVVNNRQAASDSADKIVNSNADATRAANWQARNRVTIK